MALLLREDHVTELLDIETAIAAVEEVLRDQAEGVATNRPRYRVATPTSQLHVMAAGDNKMGVFGLKTYTVSSKGARFLVLLYDSQSGDMLAMIEADRLGQMRTGAASGVATRYLARESADTLGVYGAGWQAESQMMAVCAVRQVKTVKVFSRSRERREAFARRMTALLRCDVSAVESPEEAARDCSIIITATTARTPVLEGKWVGPGTHINAVGSNFLSKAEIDVETIRRASIIAVDSIEQSRVEAGDLMPAIERGAISWESVTELGRIVAGREPGRTGDAEITIFKSNGIALEDISTALRVYNLARERGVGETVELWKEGQ
ncbi:MAG TPA: ornithine cyclodeaminase family protein [Blastocatellia bacterium]|jgi:ornithine cyclodeaminase/alanine dehydrogenase-like protein (mu-crystallin family)